MNDNIIKALAVQLCFASNEQLEGDVEDPERKDEDGDLFPTPPTRWSPLRALGVWDSMPVDVQQSWIAYASKVSIFAGLSASAP